MMVRSPPGVSSSRLLPAIVAGYEIGGVLETSFAGKTTPVGIRASAVYGPIAAAAACSKLLGLDAPQTSAAIALAASNAGGTLQCWSDGSDEWRYQVGLAASRGFIATELARAGYKAASLALEGPAGLIPAFARVECDVEDLVGRMGREWMIDRVTFKPYPVCVFNQTPVTAALNLRKEIEGASVASARIRVNPYVHGYSGMTSHGPFDSFAGMLMSTPACVAISLIHGAPDVDQLTTFDDGRVNELTRNVEVIPDRTVSMYSAELEVQLTDGSMKSISQRMTSEDFAYDRATISSTLRRFGGRQSVPEHAFKLVEEFVDDLPLASFDRIFDAFSLVEAKAIN